MISEIVQEFCQRCGLQGVSMQEGGRLCLSIDEIGDVQLLHQKGKLLVGLSRKIENLYLLNGRKILGLCHYTTSHFHPLHAQLNDDILGIFYLFEESEMTTPLLSQALESLIETMEKML